MADDEEAPLDVSARHETAYCWSSTRVPWYTAQDAIEREAARTMSPLTCAEITLAPTKS